MVIRTHLLRLRRRTPNASVSARKAFTLTNTGQVSLTPTYTGIQWSSVEGAEPDLFTVASDNCGTLEPGASCAVEVALQPHPSGSRRSVSHHRRRRETQPMRGHRKRVSRQARVPARSSRSGLRWPNFEAEGFGRRAAQPPQRVKVADEGQADLRIRFGARWRAGFHFDDDQFVLEPGGTCGPGAIVLPSGFCTVRVAFAPTAASRFSADLRIDDNAPDSPQYATLEGTGVPSRAEQGKAHVVIVEHPPKVTRRRRAEFAFKGSAGTTEFECRIDSNPFKPCLSPVKFARLKAGRHRFAVRDVNAAGQVGSRPARFSWRIERRPSKRAKPSNLAAGGAGTCDPFKDRGWKANPICLSGKDRSAGAGARLHLPVLGLRRQRRRQRPDQVLLGHTVEHPGRRTPGPRGRLLGRKPGPSEEPKPLQLRGRQRRRHPPAGGLHRQPARDPAVHRRPVLRRRMPDRLAGGDRERARDERDRASTPPSTTSCRRPTSPGCSPSRSSSSTRRSSRSSAPAPAATTASTPTATSIFHGLLPAGSAPARSSGGSPPLPAHDRLRIEPAFNSLGEAVAYFGSPLRLERPLAAPLTRNPSTNSASGTSSASPRCTPTRSAPRSCRTRPPATPRSPRRSKSSPTTAA